MHRIRRVIGVAALLAVQSTFAAEDVQDCKAAEGIQALVCGDPELSGDEQALTEALAAAQRKAGDGLAALQAEQRVWLASRERCVSDASAWECVRDRTVRRTAALQARFGLIDASGRASFVCDPATHDTLELEFFPTGPLTPAAIARRGDVSVLLWLAPSGSGSRYVGPGIQVWLAHGDALVRWGKGAAQTVCRAR